MSEFNNHLKSSQNGVLILGAGHGIGLGLAQEISKKSNCKIFCTYRSTHKADELFRLQETYQDQITVFKVDPLQESEISLLCDQIKKETTKLDLIINSIGFLHDTEISPEKALKEINYEVMEKVFKINAFITPMLAKYFESFFSRNSASIFATISAKVGSIDDNKVGGWYSYRASKSALNMFLKNISIEWKRKKLQTCVLAIHPGTTVTELSTPFIKNTPYKLHNPAETAQNILNVIEKCSLNDSGKFISWDGEFIKW